MKCAVQMERYKTAWSQNTNGTEKKHGDQKGKTIADSEASHVTPTMNLELGGNYYR